ncbi:unnamed protein product [Caenorhabditis nigoni]
MANHLALIDATVIFIFYVIPSILILAIPFFATIIDMMLPLTKVSGSRKLPKSETLTLFYFRLFIDGIAGIGALLLTILDFLNSNQWINPSEVVIFFISHPLVHVTTIRSLLVVFITIDRIFAIYCPLSYRAHPSSIPNWVVILFVCISPILDDVVLLKICNFELRFPPGCMNYTCLVKQCFSQYYLLTKELVEHGIIVIGSLAIAVKLFLFQKGSKNKDLERANHLALIDAAAIFVFYLVPLFLTFVVPFFASIIELVLPLTKASGFALDGYLVYRILKRKSDITSNVQAKASVAICVSKLHLVPPMQILVNTLVFTLGAINIFIDFGLLYSIFISRTLPKSETLTLFYFRFLLDGIVGIGAILVTILNIFNSNLWISPSEAVVFFMSHPMVHVSTIRSLLVVVITLDRIFAIYFPISYRAHRSSIPNWFLILIVCMSPILDDVLLLKMGNFELRFPPGCITYTCLVKQFFSQYLMAKEMVEHGIVVIGSLAIAVKLFLFKKGSKNKDLERANHLALIDSAVIFIFYLVPSLLILMVPFFASILEIILPLTKASGYALDGYLVYRVLKRRSDMSSNVHAKASVASGTLFQAPSRIQ